MLLYAPLLKNVGWFPRLMSNYATVFCLLPHDDWIILHVLFIIHKSKWLFVNNGHVINIITNLWKLVHTLVLKIKQVAKMRNMVAIYGRCRGISTYVNSSCAWSVICVIINILFLLWPCHSSEGSRRLLTAAARVRAQVKSCGICGGQSSTGAGFLQVLRFPLPILIPPTAPHSSSGAGKIGQVVADVPSGLSFTPPQEETISPFCELFDDAFSIETKWRRHVGW
jgi:hypothetical protein